MKLVLASTSPYRAALLRRLGLEFTSHAPPFDETADARLSPRETAKAFAEGKARSLASAFGDAWILGADQTLELDGELLRKPKDRDETLAQLATLVGRTHALHAALALFDPSTGAVALDVTTVTLTMRSLSRATLERYVSLDATLGCVGGYTFEARGVTLFERVEGGDDSAIVGLPLAGLTRAFAAFGVEILDLARADEG